MWPVRRTSRRRVTTLRWRGASRFVGRTGRAREASSQWVTSARLVSDPRRPDQPPRTVVADGRADDRAVGSAERGPAGHARDGDVTAMDLVVVENAKRQPIGQRGGPPAGVPANVVHLAPGGAQRATRPLAMSIPSEHGSPERLRVGALRLPDVQRNTLGVEHDPGHLAVAGNALQCRRWDHGSVVQLGQRRRCRCVDRHHRTCRRRTFGCEAPWSGALQRRVAGRRVLGRRAPRCRAVGCHVRGRCSCAASLSAASDRRPGVGGDEQREMGPDLGADLVEPAVEHSTREGSQGIGGPLLGGAAVVRRGNGRQGFQRGAQARPGDRVEERLEPSATLAVRHPRVPPGADRLEGTLGGIHVLGSGPGCCPPREGRCVQLLPGRSGEQFLGAADIERSADRVTRSSAQPGEHLGVRERHIAILDCARRLGERGQALGQLALRPRGTGTLPRGPSAPGLEGPVARASPLPVCLVRGEHQGAVDAGHLEGPVQGRQHLRAGLPSPRRGERGIGVRTQRPGRVEKRSRHRQRSVLRLRLGLLCTHSNHPAPASSNLCSNVPAGSDDVLADLLPCGHVRRRTGLGTTRARDRAGRRPGLSQATAEWIRRAVRVPVSVKNVDTGAVRPCPSVRAASAQRRQ